MTNRELHPITRYRQAHGLTLDEFAALVPTTKGTISRIENGARDVSFAMLRRLIVATGGEVTADAMVRFRWAELPLLELPSKSKSRASSPAKGARA